MKINREGIKKSLKNNVKPLREVKQTVLIVGWIPGFVVKDENKTFAIVEEGNVDIFPSLKNNHPSFNSFH